MASPSEEYVPGPAETAYTTGRLNWTADGRLVGGYVNTRPSDWLADLAHHRRRFQQSAFKWTSGTAINLATRFTRGETSFTTIGDLRRLHTYRMNLASHTNVAHTALGEMIDQIRTGMELPDFDAVAEILEMDPVDCGRAAFYHKWSKNNPEKRSNEATDEIHRMVGKMVFRSPMLRAWELKQLWQLYVEAEALVQDAVTDLLVELDGTVTEEELAAAIERPTIAGLRFHIAEQRELRGEPGDPRRIPKQVY